MRIRLLLLSSLLIANCAPAAVVLTRQTGRIHVEIDGQPFSDFYFGPDAPKPYLHPLRSASGKIVTRRFPMEQGFDGENLSDQHHRSLWLAFKSVNGFDYWENEFSYHNPNAGKAITRIDSVHAGEIDATITWLSPSGEPQLEEHRRMIISADTKSHGADFANSPLRIVDLDINLKALVRTTFGDSKDGAFAVRVAEALSEKHGGLLINSEAGQTMAQTWGKPAKWVDYSGELDGEKLGIALFEHPSSFHHPSRWHIRDYGLLAVNPFGRNAFDKTLPVRTSVVEPGQSLHLRYRVVIHPAMTAPEIEALYQDFAAQK